MKRSMIFLLTVIFAILGLSSVYAANNKKLKLDTTYKLDLNGGGKESVKIEATYDEDDYPVRDEWYLYVNGKKTAGFMCNDYVWAINAYCIDVNTKDKYKEILVITEGNNYGYTDARVVRYCSEKTVKVMPLKGYVRSMRFASCDGKNNLYFWMDTPFINSTFGNYYCKIRGRVSSKNVTLVKQKKYPLEVPNIGLKNSFSGEKRYVLNRKMKLYKSASCKKVKQTLKPGTKFNALEIKPSKNTFWNYNLRSTVYVKVKTKNGTKGWLRFPGTSSSGSSYLKQVPGWV